MATSDVSVYNGALAMLGQSAIISFADANDAARAGAANYADERDATLRAHPWNFATVIQQLAQSNAPPNWRYTYTYTLPSNPYCLRVLGSDAGSYVRLGGKPRWVVSARTLLTDEPTINIQYVAQITDPGQWDALFTSAFKARLASVVAYAVTGNRELTATMWELYTKALKEARAIDGQESAPVQTTTRMLTEVR